MDGLDTNENGVVVMAATNRYARTHIAVTRITQTLFQSHYCLVLDMSC